jgi:phosphoribosylaminoimidazole-succinocarboxamide synthase
MPDFKFPEQTQYYKGKVRDVYTIKDNWLVMIASDRISAFDVILGHVSNKGQVLNLLSKFFIIILLLSTNDLV